MRPQKKKSQSVTSLLIIYKKYSVYNIKFCKITQNVRFRYSLLPPETLKTRVMQQYFSTGENMQDLVTSCLCMHDYCKIPSWLIWRVCALKEHKSFF